MVIERKDEENPSDLVFGTINDLAVGSDTRKWLYAATDDGCLAVYNLRRRRLDVLSDALGYSARTVAVVHVRFFLAAAEVTRTYLAQTKCRKNSDDKGKY